MENKTYVITDKDVFDYGLKQFIKDVQTILVDFNQKERIEIIDTFTLIAKSFLNEKHYSECYNIYETDFLRKYLQKSFNAEQLRIFDYFTYEGLRWNYSRILGKDDNQCSIEFVEEYKKEKTLDNRFNNLLKTYINDLQKLLHMVIVYQPETIDHNGKIKIEPEHQKGICEILKNSFSSDDYKILKELLNGKDIDENKQITYEGDINKFTDIFWSLSKSDIQVIQNDRVFIMKWINKYFRHKNDGGTEELKMGTLKKYIHTQTRKCKKPFLGIENIR